MKLKPLIIALLAAALASSCSTKNLHKSTATPAGTQLYYVTQPEATAEEAQTYINTFEQMQNYKPGYLVTMMVNEAGPKIQASLMANAAVGDNYKVICNFNIGNNNIVTAKASYNALVNNQPEICSGGFAIDYEPTDQGNNFHIDYFTQLIPMLRSAYTTAPIYLYFNPNQMLALAQSESTVFNGLLTLLIQNNVTLLWPIYSTANANSLNTLFKNYASLQKIPYQLLFDILNSNAVQTQILTTLSNNNFTQYNAAFWEVNSRVNCPIGDTKTCLANLNSNLSVFPKQKS
jgi:hypothetical protein